MFGFVYSFITGLGTIYNHHDLFSITCIGNIVNI